jgi:putative glutamine amidotransferase
LIEDLAGHRGRYADGSENTSYLDDHEIALLPGTVRTMVGAERFLTNSLHHQAVRAIAGDLRIAGRAPDGVIEAVEARFDHPFFVAVQWHPELLPDDDVVSRRIFAGFVEAASVRRRG